MRVNLENAFYFEDQLYEAGVREVPGITKKQLPKTARQVSDDTPETNDTGNVDIDVRALSEIAPKTNEQVRELEKQVEELKSMVQLQAQPDNQEEKPSILDLKKDDK